MKIFVPRYRHNLPHINAQILDSMFVQIDQRDLPAIVAEWRQMDKIKTWSAVRAFFKRNVKEFCEHAPTKHVLEPHLRRPHITLHGGSKPGVPSCSDFFHDITFETGRQTAIHGFNLWTGGGKTDKPLMGSMSKGFLAGLREIGGALPDQYLVHCVPAEFACPITDKCGPRAVNEGLSQDADITIVLPDFFVRRDILDSRCAAAIRGIGGEGTDDEWTDMLTHKKTGLRDFPLYMLNPHVPLLGHTFYHHKLEQMRDQVKCGMDFGEIFDFFEIRETPEAIFRHLVPHLERKGQLPDQVYAKYCQEHGTHEAPILPGIPRRHFTGESPPL